MSESPSMPSAPVPTVFATFAALAARAGDETLAVSGWTTVTQAQIDRFADATGDHQWIHVDAERARSGPFGGTIAHGFLTLSLIPRLLADAIRVEQPGASVNYGLNKVRFTAPVPVDSRLRARIALAACEPVAPAGLQMVWRVQVEREGGGDKPVCVAEMLVRYYPGLG